MTTILKEEVNREQFGIKCPKCSGYAHRVEATKEENRGYGCGRGYECCARAFICDACGERIVGSAEAPEME